MAKRVSNVAFLGLLVPTKSNITFDRAIRFGRMIACWEGLSMGNNLESLEFALLKIFTLEILTKFQAQFSQKSVSQIFPKFYDGDLY
jgi:hypothetical protein